MDTISSPASRKHIYALIVNESPIGRNSLKSSLEMINSMKMHEARSLARPLINAPRDKIRTIATIEASSGEEALKIIHDNPIDLVFAYHLLPDMSGLELLSQIRHEPRTALLPFILVTEVTDRTEFVNSIELGASDYLLMPFSLQSIEERVARALEGAKTQLVQWRKQLSVGDAEIDKQHQRLINLINEMYSAIVVGKGKETIKWVVDELVDYTETHFSYEENFMERISYPELAEHKLEHQGLTEQVLELHKRATESNLQVGLVIETLQFLKDWLTRHIVASDLKCIKFAKNSELSK